MEFWLYDDKSFDKFYPLSLSRPLGAFRLGILTIAEKWEHELNGKATFLTRSPIAEKFNQNNSSSPSLYINGRITPNNDTLAAIKSLPQESVLMCGDVIVAAKSDVTGVKPWEDDKLLELSKVEFTGELNAVNQLTDLFSFNGEAIQADFDRLTKGRQSAELPSHNILLGDKDKLFIEPGATVNASILNTQGGPIYIGKDAEVMEGSKIRGPFALCDHAATKLDTKIYGPTTVGPHSKVGGELNNVVIFGYSNKGHDGFLGNSVLGEWCNLGADTNNSNLKNNYAEVKLWNYKRKGFAKTGLQFCGLIMGDHSKCGINTMFNTGTVVGFSSNIFGSGFPRNFVPDFAWGGASGFTTYLPKKAIEVAKIVMARRKLEFTQEDEAIFNTIFEENKADRVWETTA